MSNWSYMPEFAVSNLKVGLAMSKKYQFKPAILNMLSVGRLILEKDSSPMPKFLKKSLPVQQFGVKAWSSKDMNFALIVVFEAYCIA